MYELFGERKSVIETIAKMILVTAIQEERCGELLDCLFEGGSATVDSKGKLVLVDGSALAGLS